MPRDTLNYYHKPVTQILYALLPLLGEAISWRGGLLLGIFISACVLLFASFFRLTSNFFPKNLLTLAWILGSAAIFQAGHYWISQNPLWIVSFLILFDWHDVDPNRLGPKPFPLMLRLSLFLAGVTLLGWGHEMLGLRWQLLLFQAPAGMLILLTILAGIFLSMEPFLAPQKARRGRA